MILSKASTPINLNDKGPQVVVQLVRDMGRWVGVHELVSNWAEEKNKLNDKGTSEKEKKKKESTTIIHIIKWSP